MKITFLVPTLLMCPGLCFGQIGGNIGYAQGGGSGNAKAEQNERTKRSVTHDDLPPTSTGMFVEASVLMNVKADEYVAVFGVSQEGTTITECGQKMDATIKQFENELNRLGIGPKDHFVDFVAQNKILSTGQKIAGSFDRLKGIAPA